MSIPPKTGKRRRENENASAPPAPMPIPISLKKPSLRRRLEEVAIKAHKDMANMEANETIKAGETTKSVSAVIKPGASLSAYTNSNEATASASVSAALPSKKKEKRRRARMAKKKAKQEAKKIEQEQEAKKKEQEAALYLNTHPSVPLASFSSLSPTSQKVHAEKIKLEKIALYDALKRYDGHLFLKEYMLLIDSPGRHDNDVHHLHQRDVDIHSFSKVTKSIRHRDGRMKRMDTITNGVWHCVISLRAAFGYHQRNVQAKDLPIDDDNSCIISVEVPEIQNPESNKMLQFKIRIIVLRQSLIFDPAEEGRNTPSDSDISESRVFNRSSYQEGVDATVIVGIPADDPQIQHLILMRFHGYYKLQHARSANTLYSILCGRTVDLENGHSGANTAGAYFLRTPDGGDGDHKLTLKTIFRKNPYMFGFTEAKSHAALILNDLNNGKYTDILPNKQTFSIRPGAVAAEMERLSMAQTAMKNVNKNQLKVKEISEKTLFDRRFLLSTCSNRTVRWTIVCHPYGFQLDHFSSETQCLENRICLRATNKHDDPGRGGGNAYTYCVQTCNDEILSEHEPQSLLAQIETASSSVLEEGEVLENQITPLTDTIPVPAEHHTDVEVDNHPNVKDKMEKVRMINLEPSFDPARYSRQELCDAMKESKRVCKDMERREALRLEEIACRIFESEDEK